jgi:hypothetical protein
MEREKRKDERLPHQSEVRIENIDFETIVIGQLYNYCRGGFYFESDVFIKPGRIVFVGIRKSPYGEPAGSCECHRVKIKWCRGLYFSRYKYGYGVQHLDPTDNYLNEFDEYYYDIPKYLNLILANEKEARRKRRKPIRRPIYFSSGVKYCEGIIKNVSSSGFYIETKEQLAPDQIIRLIIPGTKYDGRKMIKAQIVHEDAFGFGVKVLGVLRPRSSVER